MGLIDSTNAVKRELLTARQQKELERTEKKREKIIKERDKFDEALALEELKSKLQAVFHRNFSKHNFNSCCITFNSIKGRNAVFLEVVKNDLELKYFENLYYKELKKVIAIYKNNLEYFKLVNVPAPPKSKKYIEIIKKTFKIIGYILIAIIGIVAGFTALIYKIQPERKRRFRI